LSQSESLGSILFGDRLFNSPFKVGEERHLTNLIISLIKTDLF
jgi:hypothetical protein